MTAIRRAVGSPAAFPAAVAVAVIACDQITKQWALWALDTGPIDLVWTLRLRLTFNSGMAFGAGSGIGPLIGVAALAVVVILVRHTLQGESRRARLASGILLGGAVGNLIDRLLRDEAWLRGSVVDFIDLQWFPVFNVADMAINLGAVLLVIAMWLESRQQPAAGPNGDDAA